MRRCLCINTAPLSLCKAPTVRRMHLSRQGLEVRRRRRGDERREARNAGSHTPTCGRLIGRASVVRASEREESSFGHGCSRWHAIPRADTRPPPPAPVVWRCVRARITEASPTACGADRWKEGGGQTKCHRVNVWPVLFRDGSDKAARTSNVSPSSRDCARRKRNVEASGENVRKRAFVSLVLSLSLAFRNRDTSHHARRRSRA